MSKLRKVAFAIRVQEDLYDRLDAIRAQMAKASPFSTVTISHAIRRVMAAGLQVVELEVFGKTTGD